MVEITLFTDTVKCAGCREIDMYNGLKKVNGNWVCKKCEHNPLPPPQPREPSMIRMMF